MCCGFSACRSRGFEEVDIDELLELLTQTDSKYVYPEFWVFRLVLSSEIVSMLNPVLVPALLRQAGIVMITYTAHVH